MIPFLLQILINIVINVTEQPKVAFSVALLDSGFMGPVSVDTNLVNTKVITNVGQAYSHVTGTLSTPEYSMLVTEWILSSQPIGKLILF